MPLITYNEGVPATNNDPSVDQPNMLSNTINLKTIWDQDHITFDAENSGTHEKMTFFQNTAPFTPASADQSQIYPALPGAGEEATSTILKYVNFSGTFTLNCVKAFGAFVTVGVDGPATLINGMNVVSINRVAGVYTIAITPNAFIGTNAVIISNSATASITGANTAQITLLSAGVTINFVILQV